MSKLEVREAFKGDFEQVYPLLRELDAPQISREEFRRIFEPSWQAPRDSRGFILSDSSGVQGFLGTLFAKRVIGGSEMSFCNMTSWIVRPAARASSIMMLTEMLKLKSYVFTNFTPSPTVARLLQAVKFREIEHSQRFIPAIPHLPGSSVRVRVVRDGSASNLSGIDAQVFNDHQRIGCVHAIIEKDGEQCYALFRRVTYRRMPFIRAQYVGNPAMFRATIARGSFGIAASAGTLGLLVEERYLDGQPIRWSREVPAASRWFFRGPVAPAEIDTAYSEMVLLHA
jgi:hypothetical protein